MVEGIVSPHIRAEYDKTRSNGPHDMVCYAPFKHLYIGHGGNVYACCYSRGYILGKYPENNLKDIWNGARIRKLREKMKRDDLLPACHICHEQLSSGNYTALQARPFDEAPRNDTGYPNIITFELENSCNLECGMCSGEFSSLIRKNREGLPPIQHPYDAAFFEQLDEFIPHLFEAKFLGGEPFLIKSYYRIWDTIAQNEVNTRVFLQTNGTVLTSKVRDLLQKIDFHIGVSIDSLQAKRYEDIRKNAKFDVVINNFRQIRDYCLAKGTFIGISVCAMKQNWDEMADFARFCNDNNTKLYINTLHYPLSHSLTVQKPEDLDEVLKFYQGVNLPASTALEKQNHDTFFDWLNQIRQWKKAAEAKAVAAKEPAVKIDEKEQLKQSLLALIQQDSTLDADQINIKLQEAMNKLENCLAVLPAHALEHVTSFENAAEIILANSEEKLLEMARALSNQL